MSWRDVRPIAIGVPTRGDEALLSRLHDPGADEWFYRPVGGGIEFGEHSREALAREFREELDVTVDEAEHLATLERTFEFDGEREHEIAFCYRVDLAEDWPYERESFRGYERAADDEFEVRWLGADDLDAETVYPEELPALLER